jgi:hypothetical protein
MNRAASKRIFCFLLAVVILGLFGTRCAAPREELHAHGDMAPVKTYPKDYVHPIADINLDKVIHQNRGLKVFIENATAVHDYYRGGVQEKAEGERLLKEGQWERTQISLDKSNRFLQVVVRYLPQDEAYRNIYGDHVVIFLPNLLMADNYLKLSAVYKKMGKANDSIEAERLGKEYLSRSLASVKTEWASQIQKGFEEAMPKK